MLDEQHVRLLPSIGTTEQLEAIARDDRRVSELAARRHGAPDPQAIVSIHEVRLPDGGLSYRAQTSAAAEAPSPEGGSLVFQMVRVPVPTRVGSLFVSRMPGYGRGVSVAAELDALLGVGVRHLVGLVPSADLDDLYKNPDYLRATQARFGDQFTLLEVVDYEAPGDDDAFERTVERVDELLARGESVFVHCGAGCGRAGVFASCVLVHAGLEPLAAVEAFRRARGCGPEAQRQVAYVVRYASRLR